MEFIVLVLFCLALFVCLLLDLSILIALVAGLLIFWCYGLCKGYSFGDVVCFSISGVKTVKNILITFFLIGMLTAIWREAGTISVIVCLAAKLIQPAVFLLLTFLLNCLISFLTGTAFGAAATMGVICSTMGASLQISPILTGGAVLSGVYFGDRCSPVSTSALLVATLTQTDIFNNIKKMLQTATIPFLLTCLIYALIGFMLNGSGDVPDLDSIFGLEFNLSLWAVVPALVVLILSLCRVNVKFTMIASIIVALPVCLVVQQTPLEAIPKVLLTGYTAQNAEVAAMLNGGGIVSMLRVAAIVCISSAYSGIFQNTGLLDNIKSSLHKLAKKTSAFAAMLLTSALTGMIACNQTLTIMLTHQLTDSTEKDKEQFAIALEDSAVVVAPLVPWSIAGAVPLASIDAPLSAIAFACFLYLLPLYGLVKSATYKQHGR